MTKLHEGLIKLHGGLTKLHDTLTKLHEGLIKLHGGRVVTTTIDGSYTLDPVGLAQVLVESAGGPNKSETFSLARYSTTGG